MEKIILTRIKLVFIISSFLSVNICVMSQVIYKCPSKPDIIYMKYPNNYLLKCFLIGDEYTSLMKTMDGYPIIEAPNDVFEYAIIDKDGNMRWQTG